MSLKSKNLAAAQFIRWWWNDAFCWWATITSQCKAFTWPSKYLKTLVKLYFFGSLQDAIASNKVYPAGLVSVPLWTYDAHPQSVETNCGHNQHLINLFPMADITKPFFCLRAGLHFLVGRAHRASAHETVKMCLQDIFRLIEKGMDTQWWQLEEKK